jgi:hypothetical protein
MRKVFIILVTVFLILTAGTALAETETYDPYDKDYAVSIQWMRTFLENSDFKDYWDLESSYDGWGISVERKFRNNASIELTGGYGKYDKDVDNVFSIDDTVSASIKGYYLSLTPKQYFQLSDDSALYVGGGPDYYDIKLKLDYISPLYTEGMDDRFHVLGLHAVAGIDLVVIKNPGSQGSFDAPLSIFVEYRYSWVKVDDADKKLIDKINKAFGSSEDYHDLNMGGHTGVAGLRWRF